MRQRHPVSSTSDERGPRPRLWSFGPPLIVFLVVNIVLLIAAQAEGHHYLDPATWTFWDSFHYIEISEEGYQAEACTRFRLVDWGSMRDTLLESLGFEVQGEDVCGNAGWFPGYPMAIRLVSSTGLSPPSAAVVLAIAFQLATLFALWRWFLARRERTTALTALAMAGFFFGHVYFRAAFPISIFTFLVLLHLRLAMRERWLSAGVAGAAAAFVYPTGFLLAPATLAWVLYRREARTSRRLRGAAAAGSATLVGFAAVHLVQWRATGIWLAFFKIQSRFGYGMNPPTDRLIEVISPVFSDGLSMATVPALHSLATTIFILGLLGLALVHRRDLDPEESWSAIAMTALWLFPLILGGDTSLYRIHAVLVPAVLLFPRAPAWFGYAAVAVGVALSYPMALLFFRGTLI